MTKMKQRTLLPFFLYAVIFSAFSDENSLLIIDGEKLVMEITDKNGETYYGTTTYYIESTAGETTFNYFYEGRDESWSVWTDSNGMPFKIIFENENGILTLLFDHEGEVTLQGTWKNREIEKEKLFQPDNTFVTLENTLVLRTLDLESDEKYEFDLLQNDKLPRLDAYRMYFQVVGEETVTVQAGTFYCKKVLFSLSDWRGLFWQACYYITDDCHRYIVKIMNIPDGGESELIKIE
jgi:hypothetical protein